MAVDIKVAAQRAEARIGSVIKDRWRLDRLLGIGGMASVYAATHRNKKRAAIKVLHPELSSDSAVRERFLREGYLANSVGHRGAVSVDDDDVTADGSAFIVMELLEGETIEQRWRRKMERLPLEEVLAIGDQVLDTLAAAHDQGIVHRDLKPENLFLTREGVVKLLDFGIGRLKEMKGVHVSTLSGSAMGTPAFMAPEQARGRWHEVDGQTDVWALGATLFTLLTGEYVHQAPTVNEVLALACTRPARPLGLLRPDLPADALALIDKALAYAKAERFTDARSMQAQLRMVYARLVGQEGSRAPQLSVPDVAPSMAESVLSEPSDPRLRMTTARSVSASELPWSLGARALLGRRHGLVLAGSGLALLSALVLLVRGCSESDTALASAAPAAAAPLPSVARPAQTPPVAAPAEVDALGAVPRISVEELPRERSRKPNASTPARQDESSVRRR